MEIGTKVKTFLLHVNDHQILSTIEESESDRMI